MDENRYKEGSLWLMLEKAGSDLSLQSPGATKAVYTGI